MKREGMAQPDAASAAGLALAQKKMMIANGLGLDPNLPLSELMAAASKKMGISTSHLDKAELQNADGLVAAAAPTTRVPPTALGQTSSAATACLSCGQMVAQVCAVNGCCTRCLYQVLHFDQIGHKATSATDEAALHKAGGPRAFTYGEITTLGFRRLCARLKLRDDDVFADCGSGTGRIVVQAVTEFGVRRAVGVELSSSRHRLALEMLAASARPKAEGASKTASKPKGTKGKAKGKGRQEDHSSTSLHERASFVCGDCAAPQLWTAADGAFTGTTVVFTCSIMFDEALMARLARCIEACPTVRVVASFQRFPTAHGGLRGFVEAEPPEPCEASWTVTKHSCPLLSGAGACTADPQLFNGSPVYIYERTSTAAAIIREDEPGPGEAAGAAITIMEAARAAGLALIRVSQSGASEWVFSGS